MVRGLLAWDSYVTNLFYTFYMNCTVIARFILERANKFFSVITLNWSEEKIIRFQVDCYYFPPIYPAMFFPNIKKVIIEHISYVLRILMDNVIRNISIVTIFSRLRFFLSIVLMMMRQICYLLFFAALNLCS